MSSGLEANHRSCCSSTRLTTTAIDPLYCLPFLTSHTPTYLHHIYYAIHHHIYPLPAVLFYNLLEDGNGDDLAVHAALPVYQGEKWLANFWVWDPKKSF